MDCDGQTIPARRADGTLCGDPRGTQPAQIRLRKRPPDQMERRPDDERVTQAADTIDHDPLELAEVVFHRRMKSCRGKKVNVLGGETGLT